MITYENTEINYKNIPENLSDEQKEEYKLLNNPEFMQGFKAYMLKQDVKGAIIFYQDYIKTNGFVGVVRYKNFQLDILPKLLSSKHPSIDDDGNSKQDDIKDNCDNEEVSKVLKNLIFMISKTQKLEIKVTEQSDLNHCDNPFLEVLIREYAVSLFECLKRLTPRNYVREEENLNYLKGKLKFTENIRYNCANQAKFYCEYDEFSENNKLNRLFLFIAKSLFKITKSSDNRKILSFIMNYFCDLPFEVTDKYKAGKIILTRNQKLFEYPFKLAKMFLEHISIDISQKTIENVTLLWSMGNLFEEFVAELINKGQSEYSVCIQKDYPLLKNKSKEYNRKLTYVDVLLEKNDETRTKIILDTKYKLSSLDSGDIYQVSTYCLLHNSHNAILFYPMDKPPDENDIKNKNKYFKQDKVRYWLNTVKYEVAIDRIYINLFLDDLRKLFDNVNSLVDILNNIIEQNNQENIKIKLEEISGKNIKIIK